MRLDDIIKGVRICREEYQGLSPGPHSVKRSYEKRQIGTANDVG